jgi:hypothetical protein
VQPACATAKAAGSAAETAFTTLNTTCTKKGVKCCTEQKTKDAWKVLQAYHDMCEHDEVPTYLEVNYHNFDSDCAASSCNVKLATYDGTKCPPPPPPAPAVVDCDDHGHDHRRRLDGHDDCEHSHSEPSHSASFPSPLTCSHFVYAPQRGCGSCWYW